MNVCKLQWMNLFDFIKSREYVFILTLTLIYASLYTHYYDRLNSSFGVVLLLLSDRSFIAFLLPLTWIHFLVKKTKALRAEELIRYEDFFVFILNRCVEYLLTAIVLVLTVIVIGLLWIRMLNDMGIVKFLMNFALLLETILT